MSPMRGPSARDRAEVRTGKGSAADRKEVRQVRKARKKSKKQGK